MFEAKFANASLLKKVIEAIKDLVNDAPFDCNENAMCLQVCVLFGYKFIDILGNGWLSCSPCFAQIGNRVV
jgi:hypothetical protein